MSGLVVVTSPEQLAAALRARRQDLRMPLRVVGERADMALQQVWEVENFKVRPGPEVLLRIAGAMWCRLALFQDEPR
jgi:transcriptional regulator with XRE-family HTH domain